MNNIAPRILLFFDKNYRLYITVNFQLFRHICFDLKIIKLP